MARPSFIAGLVAISLIPDLSDIKAAQQELAVTATAYNSLPGQTQGDPKDTAFGDVLKPGMKAIAVSPDLLQAGLTHGTEVKIDGLPGTYAVRDKMPKRWRRRIDIYMGRSVKTARTWGKRTVAIHWYNKPRQTAKDRSRYASGKARSE